jgi:hypothetical protein
MAVTNGLLTLNYSIVYIVINKSSWSNTPVIRKGFIYHLLIISRNFYNKRQKSHLDSTTIIKIVMLCMWGNILVSKIILSKSSFLKAKPGLIESLDTTQVLGETVSRGLRNNIFIYPSKHVCVVNTKTPNKQRSYLYIKPDSIFTIRKIN